MKHQTNSQKKITFFQRWNSWLWEVEWPGTTQEWQFLLVRTEGHRKNLGKIFWSAFIGSWAWLLSDRKPLQIWLEDLFLGQGIPECPTHHKVWRVKSPSLPSGKSQNQRETPGQAMFLSQKGSPFPLADSSREKHLGQHTRSSPDLRFVCFHVLETEAKNTQC